MKCSKILFIGLLILVPIFYATFIERFWIIERLEQRNLLENRDLRVVLIADPHLGPFKGINFLFKVVDRIKGLRPDLILIAGDFTYTDDVDDFRLFAPFKELDVPVYAVTGNHDTLSSGELTSEQVRDGVSKFGVQFIDNRMVDFQGIKLVGLSDIWEGDTKFALLNEVEVEDMVIVLVHNPDAAYRLPEEMADLVVAGHTHGGQICLPILCKMVIPTEHDFWRGWYEVVGNPLYVTSGLGEVILPMRFLMPPEIVIFDL